MHKNIMMFRGFFACFATLLNCATMTAGEIALSFDDAPTTWLRHFSGHERTTRILGQLKRCNVAEAVFFANPESAEKKTKNRLMRYSQAGHIIANHTWDHAHIDDKGVDSYLQGIQRADRALARYPTFKRWFRYPYLEQGRSHTERNRIKKWLKKNKYRHGHVTIETKDWLLSDLFQETLKQGQKVNFERLKKLYIDHIWQSIEFYDRIGQHTLKRPVKHVLLLHENDLSAMFLCDLVTHIRSKKWTVIRSSEAYNDAITDRIPATLENGSGLLWALAVTKSRNGYKKLSQERIRLQTKEIKIRYRSLTH